MPEIRFSITKKFDEVIKEITNGYGVDKSDYIKGLILADLKSRGKK